MKLLRHHKWRVILSASLCIALLSGCASSSDLSATPSSSAPVSSAPAATTAPPIEPSPEPETSAPATAAPEELSPEQLEQAKKFLYQWFFFFHDPVASPSKISKDSSMLRFLCDQTQEQKSLKGEEIQQIGDPSWALISLPAAEVEQMSLTLLGDSVDSSLLPKVPLPCAVDELEEHLKELDFRVGAYYIPDQDTFLVPSVYGLVTVGLEITDIHLAEDSLVGVIQEDNPDGTYNFYTYHFQWNPEVFPFLTLLFIE